MKKRYLLFFILSFWISGANAQETLWLNSTPSSYNLNPEMPQQTMDVEGDRIYSARIDNHSLSFGSVIYGTMSVDCRDTSGNLLWSFSFGPKAVLESVVANGSGMVLIGGLYMETMYLNGTDSLLNTGTNFNVNIFLLALNASGGLIWKRNVSLSHPDAMDLSMMRFDHMNRAWYGLQFFDSTSVKMIDVNGQDVQSKLLTGTRSMRSFDFDAQGNLFITGSTQWPSLNVEGLTIAVPEPYMMFLTRINTNGTASWIRLAHDVTFQNPYVVTCPDGGAYLGGDLTDSTSWGNVHFDGAQWVYDLFLTKVDSLGNFSWGIEVPVTPNISGDFHRGKNNFMDVDASGNLYITGTLRGTVDWGNGVITDVGTTGVEGISIISFDGNGIGRWQVTGTATGFQTPYSICVTAADECYFSCSVVGTVTFDSLSANQNGNYAYVIGKIGTPSATSVPPVASPDEITIYPVPAKDYLFVERSGIYPDSEIRIFNALGMLISKSTLSGSKTRIDISELSPGLYFLQSPASITKLIVLD